MVLLLTWIQTLKALSQNLSISPQNSFSTPPTPSSVRVSTAGALLFLLPTVAFCSASVRMGFLQFIHLAAVVCKRIPETGPGLLRDGDWRTVLTSWLWRQKRNVFFIVTPPLLFWGMPKRLTGYGDVQKGIDMSILWRIYTYTNGK